MSISYKKYFEEGLSTEMYKQEFESRIALGDQEQFANYYILNKARSKRIENIKLTDSLVESLKAINEKIYWLIITEPWCGDSAQIVPVLDVAVSINPLINLKYVLRDTNGEIIEAHLTNGGKAIPKLLILNENFEVLKTWGPRPLIAQDLVVKLKSNNATLETYAEELHKWYAKDKQQEIQKELAALIRK